EPTGLLRLSERATPGSYVLEYRISEAADPDNNDVAKIRFVVSSSSIIVTDDAAVTNQNQAVTIPVLANDETESGVFNLASLNVTLAPTNGSATVNADGTISYSPATNFNGEDRFSYQVCDSEDGTACATAVVTVTVRPILIGLRKIFNQTKVIIAEPVTYTIYITINSTLTEENIVFKNNQLDLLFYASK